MIDDEDIQLVAMILVVVVVVSAVVILIVDAFHDFLPDDVSAPIAGFIGGIVATLAVGLARKWGSTRPE